MIAATSNRVYKVKTCVHCKQTRAHITSRRKLCTLCIGLCNRNFYAFTTKIPVMHSIKPTIMENNLAIGFAVA